MKFKIREAGRVRIIALSGTLDLGTSVAIHAAFKELLSAGHSQVVFNLKRVPWIDTSGTACLVSCKKRALDRGGDVVLLNPTGKTARILRSCLIQTYISIFEDELTAVGSFAERHRAATEREAPQSPEIRTPTTAPATASVPARPPSRG